MERFEVETGWDSRTVLARNWRDALRRAWKVKPPRTIGILIRIRSSRESWGYLSGEEAVKIAGYKIERL